MGIPEMPNPIPMSQLSLYLQSTVSSITDMISSENVDIPSPSVDFDSEFDLNIPIFTIKETKVTFYIHCITYYLINILQHIIVHLFPTLFSSYFYFFFQMPQEIQVGRQR